MSRLRGKKGSLAVSPSSMNVSLPLSVLRDRSVAVLESIVEYLKDKKGLTYHEIAVMLNRDDRTVWTVYSRVKKKRSSKKTRGGHDEQ